MRSKAPLSFSSGSSNFRGIIDVTKETQVKGLLWRHPLLFKLFFKTVLRTLETVLRILNDHGVAEPWAREILESFNGLSKYTICSVNLTSMPAILCYYRRVKPLRFHPPSYPCPCSNTAILLYYYNETCTNSCSRQKEENLRLQYMWSVFPPVHISVFNERYDRPCLSD